MLSGRIKLFTIAVHLFLWSGMALASDDNPWIMDETGDGQQSYFDLNSEQAPGGEAFGPKSGAPAQPRFPSARSRVNETTIPKTAPFKGAAGRAGKENRDQYFGYAGPLPKLQKDGKGALDAREFGAFPSPDGGAGVVKRPARTADRFPGQNLGHIAVPNHGRYVGQSPGGTSGRNQAPTGSIQFGGKSYGAFAPKEKKPISAERQQWQAFQAFQARQKRQKTSAFSNVAPPPVPEPVPGHGPYNVWPGGGYGVPPGYGSGMAQPWGQGGYYGGTGPGIGGLYGPLQGIPVTPGLMMPGITW